MSAPPHVEHPDPSSHVAVARGRWTPTAVLVTGLAIVTEAILSGFTDSHVAYHALSAVLHAALMVSALSFARAGRGTVGRAGVVGGWAVAGTAALALGGGVWAVLTEGLAAREVPGVVEGITHTAVLVALLFLVPLGLGLRGVSRVAGSVIAGSSASLVGMVLAGLDQPEVFLVPEAILGLGWLLLRRDLAPRAEATSH